jgi:hypothetical protein
MMNDAPLDRLDSIVVLQSQRPSLMSSSRRAGCEDHKSGSERGAPGRPGVPTRRASSGAAGAVVGRRRSVPEPVNTGGFETPGGVRSGCGFRSRVRGQSSDSLRVPQTAACRVSRSVPATRSQENGLGESFRLGQSQIVAASSPNELVQCLGTHPRGLRAHSRLRRRSFSSRRAQRP